ncbi:MAG: hypothetical protein DI587_17065 [Variovorax paradoxus]|nr:MAG: hypothetical protein DI583_17065 [Variovorax paradoxus]PZQ08945.1 MAG: hypothetical protein DI587_17065 [Variovorax paradoxus]
MAELQHFPVGGPVRRPQASVIEVRIVRPFFMAGKRIEIGERLQLAPAFAGEMVSAGKAERYTAVMAAADEAAAAAAAKAAKREREAA